MRSVLILFFLPFVYHMVDAQVGVGTVSPNAKAALDITATGKGLLIPRMDSVTRVAITTPLPDGLMVFQTDGRKGFWYAVSNTWLYIPDKTQVADDNLGNHIATQTFDLNSQQLVANTGYPRGDSTAQVNITSYINSASTALQTRSSLDEAHPYTRSLLSGYGQGPANTSTDYGIWSHSYRAGGWAVLASGGLNPLQSNHWVGLGQGPSSSSLGATIRIVDGNQGAGKLLTSDANGNGTWQAPSFTGNVAVGGTLTVQNGKGIIRSTGSTQQKMQVKPQVINVNLPSFGSTYYDITWPEAFTSAPAAYVGNMPVITSGWGQALMSLVNVTTTGARLYVSNAYNAAITMNFTVNIMAIGTE